jgi:hypothetical protein
VTQHLLADVLGALMAGQERRTATEEFGHAARRTELGYGPGSQEEHKAKSDPPSSDAETPKDVGPPT